MASWEKFPITFNLSPTLSPSGYNLEIEPMNLDDEDPEFYDFPFPQDFQPFKQTTDFLEETPIPAEFLEQTPYSFTPAPKKIEVPAQIVKEEQVKINQPTKTQDKLPKKINKKTQIKKGNDKKNIARYLTRQIIRSLISEHFRNEVLPLTKKYNIPYKSIQQYYESNIESFTNLRIISQHWQVEENDFSEINKIHAVFRDFSKWFLKKRAIRYILFNGKMTDKKAYIDYKNKVMLPNIENPKKYNTNK